MLSADGMKPIEEIRKGDWVWSVAPETGDPELKQVEDVFVNETDEIVHVRYGDTEIDATPTHPFYTPDRGWVSAVNLRAGDRLQLVNGEYVTVEQVQHEILESPVKVYNFRVADNHTYYVGHDNAVLVHNASCGNRIVNVLKGDSPIWKKFQNAKNGLKKSGAGRKTKYYSWDNLHNEIEVFDHLGKHLGAMDPSTGDMIKPAVSGRRIKL